MALIDDIKAHYQALGTRSIRVPEWGNVEIFVAPFTLGEQARLYAIQTDPKQSQFDLYAATIALKAKDKDGNRLLSDADIKQMMNGGDKDVIERVASEIVQATSVDDLKKSSEATSDSETDST